MNDHSNNQIRKLGSYVLIYHLNDLPIIITNESNIKITLNLASLHQSSKNQVSFLFTVEKI